MIRRVKYVIVVAGILIAAVQAVPASATTSGWMVNGSTLTGTAALATTAAVENDIFEFDASEVKVTCKGNTIHYVKPSINDLTGMADLASAEFTGCSGNTVCPLTVNQGTTLDTLPLLVDLTLQGTLAIKGVFLPANASKMVTTVEFGGSECSFAGVDIVSGTQGFLAPIGRDERVPQLLVAETLTPGELKLASASLFIKGSALVKLASALPFSFL